MAGRLGQHPIMLTAARIPASSRVDAIASLPADADNPEPEIGLPIREHWHRKPHRYESGSLQKEI